MNLLHRWYCGSPLWKRHVRSLLPWATTGLSLTSATVLEIGSGPGLTTDWLFPRVGQLTALEYDQHHAAALAARRPAVTVVNGDATKMPFGDDAFDLVLSFTMLHYVPSPDLQDRLFREAARVLRPGGIFAGSDSRWSRVFAVAHLGDTMVLVDEETLPNRLTVAGFIDAQTSGRRDAVRFRAAKPTYANQHQSRRDRR